MPLIKSAKKRMRQEATRRDRNRTLKTFMKNLRKKTMLVLDSTDSKKEDKLQAINTYKASLDKAWSTGLFKRNKASRLKSRIDHLCTKIITEAK